MKHDGSAKSSITRRGFLAVTGAAAAGGAVTAAASELEKLQQDEALQGSTASISNHRVLGRTGFKVSDIALGGMAKDANVVRYAYDHGINYFDTAESYGNGDAERKIGDAMQHLDRSKIFITTKLQVKEDDTTTTLLDRYAKCLERMKTDYADALLIHAVSDVTQVGNKAFHEATKQLRADGRLRYAGISSHGPRDGSGDSMEKVLLAAVEDGRHDIMLLTYNFLNAEEAEKVLAACKKSNIGTTAMKTAPGALDIDIFDPENPSKRYADYIDRQVEAGERREDVVAMLVGFAATQRAEQEKTKPFREKHGLTSPEAFRRAAVQWVLQNPDMHTTCLGLRDFEAIEQAVALSGTKLASSSMALLEDFRAACGSQYCRHGCTACVTQCRHGLPVSTIMRYSYYFAHQGREKYAMSRYAGLEGKDASLCLGCNATCDGACPHQVPIRAQLMEAHALLSMA